MCVNANETNGYHGVANGNLSHSSDLSDSSDSDSDSNDSGIHPFHYLAQDMDIEQS